ncbi:MAG: glycosyltransferase family 4 protein [Deltaproteobacteria bacterium]|nr:glycosyltransferase family 4 protein [Deltaproteobacteria bacterium]
MRIVLLTPVYFPVIGGVTNTVDQLRKAAISRGDSVLIVTPVGSVSEESIDGNVMRLCIPDHPAMGEGPFGYLRAQALRTRARYKMRRLLQEYKTEIIHIQCPVPKFQGLLPSEMPILITYQGSDVLQLHGPTSSYLNELNDQARHVSAVSGALLAEIVDLRPQLMGKASRIPNGRPSAEELSVFREQTNGGERYVLFAGDLNYRKAPDVLLRSFLKLPSSNNHLLYFIGDGPQRDELRNIATRLNIADKVRFLGTLNRESTLGYIRNADVVVVPSRREGLPLVILEAMSLGCPVVASAISACVALIKHGLNGYLFEPENAAELAEYLGRIITDESHREELSHGCLKAVLSHPTWDKVYEQYRSTYEQLLAGSSGPTTGDR